MARRRPVPVVAVLADGQRAVCGRQVWAFYTYAPIKIEYAINRYAMEVKRQMDVLNPAPGRDGICGEQQQCHRMPT